MLIVNQHQFHLAGVASLGKRCVYCSKALAAYPLIMCDDADQSVYHVTCALELASDLLADAFTFFLVWRGRRPLHSVEISHSTVGSTVQMEDWNENHLFANIPDQCVMPRCITKWKHKNGSELWAYMEPSTSEEDNRHAQLEAIFRAHVADLYRYIYRQVHQAVIAEDLTSSVFLKAMRWLQQDRSPESVKGWLYATAHSVIADYWRERAQINLLPLETAEEMPALSPESHDEQQQVLQTSLQRLLDGLPSRERDVLTLRYFQGYSAAEIGQALGLSANYVRVLQLRALRHAAALETTERIIPMESPALPYNQQALRVLELTKEEARALNHNFIGTEHLLLGILDEGSAATELITHGLTAERFRGAVVYVVEHNPALPGDTQEAGYTPRMQTILVLAAEEARRMGETTISPHHLLVAILREGEGMAAHLLQGLGVRLKQVGDAVRMIIDRQNNPFDKFTPNARNVLRLAEEEARQYNHPGIDREHIVLAMMREGEGIAAKVLERLGVQLNEVRAQIEKQHPAGDQPRDPIGLTASAKASIQQAVQEARFRASLSGH